MSKELYKFLIYIYKNAYLDNIPDNILITDFQELVNKINELFGGGLFSEGGIDCVILNGYIGIDLNELLEFVGAGDEDINDFIDELLELKEE